MSDGHGGKANTIITVELVVSRPAVVVEHKLKPGRYQVQLDVAHVRMIVSGPVSFECRAMLRSSAQPESTTRATLRYYSAQDALLLVLVPPQDEWVATKREAPL